MSYSSIGSRVVVIESSHLSDNQLSKIGKTLYNLILVSNQLVSNNRRINQLMVEFIDFTDKQIIPMVFVKSNLFLTKYLDKLLKLSQFRSNSNNMSNISKSICDKNICKNIELLLRRILHEQNDKEIELFEMTFISGRHEKDVIQDICRVLTKLDFNQNNFQLTLSMVNIVCISTDCSQIEKKPVISGPVFEIPEEFEAIIETQTISDNEISIEGYFKLWFHNSNYDFEKIHICFGNEKNDMNKELIIKCDLKEAILDVNLIPVMKTIKFDSCGTQTILPSILANNCRTDDIIELKISGLIRNDGLCDSLVFGIPYVLSPTRSHNMPYNELEQNLLNFQALVEAMNKKEAIIIVEHNQKSAPINYFALLSSPDKKTIIMKSLATKELLLPYSCDSVDKLMSKTPNQQTIDSVVRKLDNFPFADFYNPLYVNNNLYQFISPLNSSTLTLN